MNLNNTDDIRREFQKLFDKSPNEQIEHRAQMLSFIYLSKVDEAMEQKGWTKKKLADEIGVSASYLTQLFRGDRMLNFRTIAKMEQALQLRFEIKDYSNHDELTEDIGENAEQ